MLVSMVVPAVISIAASFAIGALYAIGALISIVAVCLAAVFEIKAAIQMKARETKFFDTFMLGVLISFGGGILANILMISSVYSVGTFISSTISSIIGTAISLCLCIMYFSKSVRVKTYFGCRPLQSSQYWNFIKVLPDFIIADTASESSNT